MILLLAALTVLVVLPAGMLVYASFLDAPPRPGSVHGNFTLDNYAAIGTERNFRATANSLIIGLGGTLFALVGGSMLAWLFARSNVPGKWLVGIAGVAPMFMSALVTSLAWSILASPKRGYINIFFESLGFDFGIDIYTLTGIIWVMGISYMPYVFLLVSSSFSMMNPELEEAAAMSGASKWKTFRTVTFPLVAPATIGASLLVFVLVLENFPVPQILGSKADVATLPSYIYSLMRLTPAHSNEAAAVSIILTVLTFLLVFLQNLYVRKRNYTTVSGKGFRPKLIDLGVWRWPAFIAVTIYIIVSVVLPFLALFLNAAIGQRFIASISDLLDFSALNLNRFVDMLTMNDVQLGLQNSLYIALGTALFGTLLYFIMTYTVQRTRAPGRRLIEYIGMIPLAVPSLVLGLGFLWSWFLLPIPLYGTIAVLVLAYAVRFMPQGYTGISSSLTQIHPDLEDSAFLSGASRARSIWNITLPLLRSGLVSTMLLIAVLTMRELSTAVFLFSSQTRPISIVIFDQWENGSLANAAAISLLYSLLLLVLTVISQRFSKSRAQL
ncbi:MAG: iron ABC transporter permease [Cryobacterium sp.]|nr:iron ABC transporter permease [Cryobacterium sp.]